MIVSAKVKYHIGGIKMGKRLSPLDFAFLQMETPECPSHVAGLQIFETPKGYKGNFVSDLIEKMKASGEVGVPFIYKLNPRGIPFDFANWIPDPNFDIDYHLRHSALPKPGTMRELLDLVSRLHARLLDRSRPLWEVYLIEGLEGGRFALYSKMHHALIDGVGGMKMVESTFGRSPDAPVKAVWAQEVFKKSRPREQLSFMDNVLKMAEKAVGPAKTMPQVLRALIEPGLGLKDTEAAAAFKAPKAIFNTKVSAARRFALCTIPLDELKVTGKAFGATVNDMFLALCSTALRRYLEEKAVLPDMPLTATVPIAVPAVKGEKKLGNEIAYMAVNLATNVIDPIDRLKTIARSAADAKRDFQELDADAIRTLGVVSQAIGVGINRLGLGSALPPPTNLVISNVPGPKEILYFGGAKLVGNYPVSLLIDGQALNITLVSHGGQLDFGLLACRNAIPDVDKVAQYILDAFEELKAAAAEKMAVKKSA